MVEVNESVIILQVYQSALFTLLSFVMFFRHGNYSKKFLGWFMALSALFALSKAVPLLLSFFPLFYFYIKSLIIPGYRFRNKEMMHLLPALLLFLLPIPFYLVTGGRVAVFNNTALETPDQSWPDLIRYAWYVSVYGYFYLQVVFYSVRIARLYKLHTSNLEKSFSYTRSISLSWVFTLMMLFLLFLILLGLSMFIGLNKNDQFHHVINVLEFLIILVFGLFALLQQDIYPERERFEKEPYIADVLLPKGMKDRIPDQEEDNISMPSPARVVNTIPKPGAEEDNRRVKKYAGSGLADHQKRVLVKKLEDLMSEKFYLNTKLTIDDVAEKLETNSKYLSQVINESHQKNFFTYINSLRILEAQRLLDEMQHQKYSIHGIARLAGFSSKSTFNEAFRRITGMTPSEYLEREG
jgi:AraC-like DNA-binding protein/uncharacterized protein YhhL (DUF1145 family)